MAGEINLNQRALQNVFSPTMTRGTRQFATNVPTTPSYNPLADAIVGRGPAPMTSGTPGHQPQVGTNWQQAGTDALGGLGGYLQANAGAKQSALQNNTQLMRDQSDLFQRQGENQLDSAQRVLQQSPAGYDIEPYANMALRRALIGSFTPAQIQAPDGIPMGKVSGGMDLSSLAPVMNQYFNDNAIRESMQQQQQLRNNVDPNTPQSQAGMQIYAPGEYDSNMGASNASQASAQSRQNHFNNSAQQALQNAINRNNDSAKFNPWAALGNLVLGGGKSLLTGGLF